MSRSTTLAIVHPVDKLQGSDDAVRTQVWAETTHLLTPMLGKLYARFEPAQKAWRQATYTPLGVVLGRTDPALFLYFFSYGKTVQKESMEFHLSGLMNSLDVEQKMGNGSIHGFVMSPKENSEAAVAAHTAWHVGMACGDILPDSGIYFAAVKQATISDKLAEDIAKTWSNTPFPWCVSMRRGLRTNDRFFDPVCSGVVLPKSHRRPGNLSHL